MKDKNNRIPNQDQPASSMTKFEIAVLNNIKGYLNSNPFNISDEEVVKKAILLAQETFKQLEDEKQL